MHDKGMKYPAIARQLGGSYDYVKLIGKGKRKRTEQKPNVQPRKSGPPRKNNAEFDQMSLPLVRSAIKDMLAADRPVRITAPKVAMKLGYYSSRFRYLPLCRAEIEKYTETYEQFWAREIEWAVSCLRRDDKSICVTAITKMINIYNHQFYRAIPYLCDETKEILRRSGIDL